MFLRESLRRQYNNSEEMFHQERRKIKIMLLFSCPPSTCSFDLFGRLAG